MPFCFRFPPMVAGTSYLMRPMVVSDLPALCDHFISANRAFAREARLSLSTFSFNDSEFHLFFLSMAMDCFETQGCSPSAFCWFLLLVSVGQRETLSLVVNGGCCVA